MANFQKVLFRDDDVRARRRRVGFALSFVGHGVGIGTMLAVSAFAVVAVKDPYLTPSFIMSALDLPAPPEIAKPKVQTRYTLPKDAEPPREPEPPKRPEDPKPIEFKPQLDEPQVELPKVKDLQRGSSLDAERGAQVLRPQADVPEANVGAAGARRTAAAAVAADGSLTRGAGGNPLNYALLDAPEVKGMGGGGKGNLPTRAPGIQVQAGNGGGELSAYPSASPATMADFRIPKAGSAGSPGGRPGGAAPGLLKVEGGGVGGGAGSGGSGVNYGAAADAPGGAIGQFAVGGKAGSRGAGGRIDGVGATLSNRYGLPLVSVNDLGQRTTEAPRWNRLLPQLTDLFRRALGGGIGGAGGELVSAELDGETLMLRYRDGVVHVIVPASDGLASLFVARTAGARPVVSKVQEGEAALAALARLTRGAS